MGDGKDHGSVAKAADAVKAQVGLGEGNQPAAILLTALTALTAVFTGLGVTGGILGRMVRNHGVATALAFVCAFVAISIGVLASATLKKHEKTQLIALLTGIAAFLLGGIFATYAAVHVWGDKTEPRLTAEVMKAATGTRLDLAVKSDGLKTGDRLRLVVTPSGGSLARTGGALYRATLSPDADGEIDAEPKVPLTPGEYSAVLVRVSSQAAKPSDCYQDKTVTCLTVRLASPERPQLTARWENTTLKIGVTAHDIPGRSLALRIVGVRKKLRRTISSWALAPDLNGDLISGERVPVPRSYARICVVASTGLEEPTCPPKRASGKDIESLRQALDAQADTVWLTLPVPWTQQKAVRRRGRSASS